MPLVVEGAFNPLWNQLEFWRWLWIWPIVNACSGLFLRSLEQSEEHEVWLPFFDRVYFYHIKYIFMYWERISSIGMSHSSLYLVPKRSSFYIEGEEAVNYLPFNDNFYQFALWKLINNTPLGIKILLISSWK